MGDELLSDILAAERDIRLQIETLEQRTAERLEALRLELERMLEREAVTLQGELEAAGTRAAEAAQREADALLAEAGACALRLKQIGTPEMDSVVLRHLARILPGGGQ